MPDMDEWAQLQRETALRVVIEEMWKEIPRFVDSIFIHRVYAQGHTVNKCRENTSYLNQGKARVHLITT